MGYYLMWHQKSCVDVNIQKRQIFIYFKQVYVTSFGSEDINKIDENVVYMKDIETRKEAYGICGECYEPGTGWRWCQPCNAKRFKDNFKNWTSGNQNIDELIQQSQL